LFDRLNYQHDPEVSPCFKSLEKHSWSKLELLLNVNSELNQISRGHPKTVELKIQIDATPSFTTTSMYAAI
jgi:hypothetical protein